MVLCNRARALEYMRRAGLDAIVATSPVNVTYFTGYYNWLAGQFKDFMIRPGGNGDLMPALGLYPAAGAPALVVDAALAVNACPEALRTASRAANGRQPRLVWWQGVLPRQQAALFQSAVELCRHLIRAVDICGKELVELEPGHRGEGREHLVEAQGAAATEQ